jgi:hypothetical protein
MRRLIAVALLLSLGSMISALAQARTGTITGVMRLYNGQPAVAVRVVAIEPGAKGSLSLFSAATETDKEGRYHLTGLLPGRYLIATGNLEAPAFYPGVETLTDAELVTVEPGQTLSVMDFRVPISFTGLTVSGRAIYFGDRGPDEIKEPAQLYPLLPSGDISGKIYRASIAQDGSFTFTGIQPGVYKIRVADPSAIDQTVTLTDRDVDGVRLPVLPPSAPVRAEVTVDRAAPLPRVFLTLNGPAGAFTTKLFLQTDGTYRTTLPQGEYRLTIGLVPDGYQVASVTYDGVDAQANPIRVRSADPAGPGLLRIRFKTEGSAFHSVQGSVTNRANERVAPPSPLVYLEYDTKGVSARGVARMETLVEPDGTFLFPNVPPGKYTVRLASALAMPVSVNVRGENVANIKFVYQPVEGDFIIVD